MAEYKYPNHVSNYSYKMLHGRSEEVFNWKITEVMIPLPVCIISQFLYKWFDFNLYLRINYERRLEYDSDSISISIGFQFQIMLQNKHFERVFT